MQTCAPPTLQSIISPFALDLETPFTWLGYDVLVLGRGRRLRLILGRLNVSLVFRAKPQVAQSTFDRLARADAGELTASAAPLRLVGVTTGSSSASASGADALGVDGVGCDDDDF